MNLVTVHVTMVVATMTRTAPATRSAVAKIFVPHWVAQERRAHAATPIVMDPLHVSMALAWIAATIATIQLVQDTIYANARAHAPIQAVTQIMPVIASGSAEVTVVAEVTALVTVIQQTATITTRTSAVTMAKEIMLGSTTYL